MRKESRCGMYKLEAEPLAEEQGGSNLGLHVDNVEVVDQMVFTLVGY